MAHELSILEGKAEMAYRGDVPWHHLGQELKEGASLDTWIKEANFTWNIDATPAMYQHKDGYLDSGKVCLNRSDTGGFLGMVSKQYKAVQPREVLEFFRKLTENEGFEMETAGALFGGKRLWALAKIGKAFKLAKEDEVRPYVLLATACDGTMQTTARFTSKRPVCNNTLSPAVNGKAEVTISHRSKFDADAVHQQMGLITAGAAQLMADAQKLAKLKVAQKDAEAFIAKLVSQAVFVETDDLEVIRKSKPYQYIMQLFNGAGLGSQMASAKGTGWGLVNAVTEYVDHRMGGKSTDHKLQNAWFGKGQDAKQLAYSGLLALA